MKKEATNLKESMREYIGRFGRRKEGESDVIVLYSQKQKKKYDKT